MKSVIASFLACFVAVGTAICFSGHEDKLVSYAAGAGLCVLNGLALYITWKRVLNKKNLVLSGMVIVIKYPLLGLIIYWVLTRKEIDIIWFLVGLSLLFPTSVLAGLWMWKNTPKDLDKISLKIEE